MFLWLNDETEQEECGEKTILKPSQTFFYFVSLWINPFLQKLTDS